MHFQSFTAGCWAVLVIYWLLAARHTKRTLAEGQSRWVRAVAMLFVALAFALYYLPLDSVPILGLRILPRSVAFESLGELMCAFGIAFAIWARHVLADNWSGAVTLKEGHTLIQDGPYGIVRHPIYFGGMVAAVGMTLALGEVRAFMLLLGMLGLLKKIKDEDRILRTAFPDEHPKYEMRVKRLLPYIW